jgi:hypothetical protein
MSLKLKVVTLSLVTLFGFSGLGFADPGQEVVAKTDASPSISGSSPTLSAGELLEKNLRAIGIREGTQINSETDDVTIIKIEVVSNNVMQSDPDFMDIRSTMAVEAQLRAKASIIESISAEAKALRSVVKFSNPVMKQIEKKEKVYRDALDLQKRQVEILQKETVQLLNGVDDAQAKVIEGATFSDKLMSLLDATVKKIDESYDPASTDEAKKKRLADLKKRLDLAKKAEKQALEAKAEIEAKEAELVDNKKRQVSSSFALAADMPLFGATAIATADSFNDLDQVLEVAVAMVWSTKLERNARDVMGRKAKGDPRPNKLSLSDWLDTQNLAVMFGPRRYLAADGSINFVGIGAVERPADAGDVADAVKEAELQAKQAAFLSLFAEVSTNSSIEKTRVDRKISGKTQPEVYKNLSINMVEEADATIDGLGIERTVRRNLIHPSTGREIIVAVANINSEMAHRSQSLMANTYALLKEFNADQSFRAGQKQGMVEAAQETKNNQQLIDQGRASGSAAVNERYDQSKQKSVEQAATEGVVTQKPAAGSGQSGAFMSDGRIERDF